MDYRGRQRLALVLPPTTILTRRVRLAYQHRQKRIVTQGVMVVKVLVPQSQGEHPLGKEFVNRVFDQVGIAVIGKVSGKSPQNAGPRFFLPQEQTSCIRGDGPAIKSGGDRTVPQGLEIELSYATLCFRWAAAKELTEISDIDPLMALSGARPRCSCLKSCDCCPDFGVSHRFSSQKTVLLLR